MLKIIIPRYEGRNRQGELAYAGRRAGLRLAGIGLVFWLSLWGPFSLPAFGTPIDNDAIAWNIGLSDGGIDSSPRATVGPNQTDHFAVNRLSGSAAADSSASAQLEAHAKEPASDRVDARMTVEPICQSKPGLGPEMVLIAAGEFMQGSPKDENGRDTDESPRHSVRIEKPFAIARCEVTVAEFRRFVEAEHYRTDAEKGDGCFTWDAQASKWQPQNTFSWLNPGFKQSDNDPVVCVSWNDAQEYLKWLNRLLKLPDKTYRLPSESEWEYTARAGVDSPYFWGDASQCAFANGADLEMKDSQLFPSYFSYATCSDGFVHTAPVGSFKANAWGLHDMAGNVWEWVEDCWHDNYDNAPGDGRAWLNSDGVDCSNRSVRGGSWGNEPPWLRSAFRTRDGADEASLTQGFRLARTL